MRDSRSNRSKLIERVATLAAVGIGRRASFRMLHGHYERTLLDEVFPEFKGEEVAPAILQPVASPRRFPAIVKSVSPPSRAAADLSFQYVPLIQCSFPHSSPDPQTSFARRNGHLEVTINTKRPELGLPYGVPARLLTIYITSEIVRSRSREVWLGRTLQDFLKRLEVPISRGERGSVTVYANQLMRLIHTAFTIEESIEEEQTGRVGIHIRQTLFVEEAQLWWDRHFSSTQEGSLLLPEALFNSMLERSAPLQTQAIRALRKSPMDLDVYAWLVHRLYRLSRPSLVPWPSLAEQIGHAYAEQRTFRYWFLESLARVARVYPEARFDVNDNGLLLKSSTRHIAPAVKS